MMVDRLVEHWVVGMVATLVAMMVEVKAGL